MSKHVVVTGAGVIGLSTAYYAARKGHRVTIVDRNPEERDGCSFGNAGMVVPSHFVPLAAPGMVALGLKWMWDPESPFYIKPRLNWDLWRWGLKFWAACNPQHVQRAAPLLRDLSMASRACFEEIAAATDNEFGLVKKGLLMLCQTQHAFEEEAHAASKARELGIPAEVLDARQTVALEPDVQMNITGSVYFPNDCHLDPGRFMAVLLARLKALGATFVWHAEVQGWRVERGAIQAVQTTQGDIAGDEFVLSGGSWSSRMVRQLNLALPLQAGKGYSLTLEKPVQQLRTCAILTEARIAVTPMGEKLRFGGTMEMAGLNEDINPVRVRGIVKAISRYYPAYRAEHFSEVRPWRGLRPCSPDGLPYVGRAGHYRNLVVATGHAMMGLSLGPITGQIVANLVSDETPNFDLTLLNPNRYA